MAQTLKGKGAIWGVGGLTVTAIITSSLVATQKIDFTKDASFESVENEIGETVGGAYFNEKNTFDISCIPIGSTSTAAKTNLDTLLPAIGTLITVVDTDSTVTDGAQAGKYMVNSAKVSRTNKGFASVDLNIMQFVANDVATSTT